MRQVYYGLVNYVAFQAGLDRFKKPPWYDFSQLYKYQKHGSYLQ